MDNLDNYSLAIAAASNPAAARIIEGIAPPTFDIEKLCFDEQIKFIRDPAPFKTAVCSRRAGKTLACAYDLVNTALKNTDRVCLYITLARTNAKKIIWGELLKINERFNLNGKDNETDLSIRFPNGSVIYCSGAKDKSEVEKFRGLPITLCYLDECQSFRPHIETLIDDVISKALYDYDGTLCLIGTPGPVPNGYFYSCTVSKEWSHHAWTMFQNPYLQIKSGKSPEELLERDLKRKGVTRDDPTIQRECFGRWVTDTEALVFKYSTAKNHFDHLPDRIKEFEYVVGVDLGFDDADAIAVIGWHPKLKKSYLIEEIIHRKQGITDLSNQIQAVIEKYNPMKIVMDTGGLGKKIAEEIQRRYSLPIHAAEKVRKFEFIELLNDAMRTERFMAQSHSQFASDCMMVEWDREAIVPKILDSFHSDICDAVLYAFRESLHWLSEPDPIKPVIGGHEWYNKQEKDMLEIAIASQKKQEDIWGDTDDFGGI